jgi:hypothetical protein
VSESHRRGFSASVILFLGGVGPIAVPTEQGYFPTDSIFYDREGNHTYLGDEEGGRKIKKKRGNTFKSITMSSSYGGRRAPNFAQYLEDLNAIPSQYDQSLQQRQTESYNIDAELALFTNTEFLDFGHFGDMSMPLGFNPADEERKAHEEQQHVADKQGDMDYMELLNGKESIIPMVSQCYITVARVIFLT